MTRSIERTETAAFAEGSLVHALVLEPEIVAEEFAVAPDINKRTKAGKAEWESFCEENAGKTVVTQEQWDKCCEMAASVRAHPEANRLFSDGVAEESYFWTDPDTGLECKCRPDWFKKKEKIVVDLKTTDNASPDGFAKSIANFRYYVQAPYYMDALGAERFIFVAVEKKPPYAVAIYELDDHAMTVGRIKIRENLTQIKMARESGNYPDYTETVEIISLPNWVLSKFNPIEIKAELDKNKVSF